MQTRHRFDRHVSVVAGVLCCVVVFEHVRTSTFWFLKSKEREEGRKKMKMYVVCFVRRVIERKKRGHTKEEGCGKGGHVGRSLSHDHALALVAFL